MEKLTSMVDFVLEQKESRNCLISYNAFEYYRLTTKYANFLKQPLEIWQFVPCKLVDGVWVVLSENYSATKDIENKSFTYLSNEYKKAKERCLFEGFELIGNECVLNSNLMIHFLNNEISIEEHFEEIITKLSKPVNTIEDLAKYNLTLTKTAQKQIGL